MSFKIWRQDKQVEVMIIWVCLFVYCLSFESRVFWQI